MPDHDAQSPFPAQLPAYGGNGGDAGGIQQAEHQHGGGDDGAQGGQPAAEEGRDAPQPAWSRRLELPFRIDADKANAKFTDGILRVELPKAEKTGVRKIAIAG